jgi:hypothetical protein
LRELSRDLRAEKSLHRGKGIGHRNAQHFGLVAIEVHEQLLRGGPKGRRYPLQLRPVLGLGQEGLDRGTGRAHVAGATILQIELEAAGGSHAGNGRGVEREDKGFLDGRELRVQPLQDIEGK